MFVQEREESVDQDRAGSHYQKWSGSIRPVSGDELSSFRYHLLRLNSHCRRARFGNETSDSFLQDYASRVSPLDMLVLGYFEENEMRGAAELRSLRQVWCAEAEAAFSVERSWQSRGIGTALMVETIRTAYRLAVEHIYLSCHVRNRPMLRIVALPIRQER
jgi:GNAT superfamily N-acetyltransferase